LTFIGRLLPGRVNDRRRERQCAGFVANLSILPRRELATRDAIDEYAVCSPPIIADTQSDTVWRCKFEFPEDAKITIVLPSRGSACPAFDPADTRR
jgi:hypothetical protein